MIPEDISAHARQFRRHETQFEARFEVHPDHAGQFRLSLPDAASGLTVLDVSQGGLGVCTGFYIPKNLRLELRISGVGQEPEHGARDLFVRAVVRRCVMTDHKPTYQVGMQFVDSSGADERKLVAAVSEAGETVGAAADVGE
jgi:hypothetical protein